MGNSSSEQAKETLFKTCGSKGNGDVEKVKRILADYPLFLNKESDSSGETVLMHASCWNHVEVVEYLLTLPALKVNKQSSIIYGRTALHFASCYGHIKIVRLLLSHPQIDTTIKTWFGKTASETCCEEFGAIRSNKAFIDDLFKNHERGKTAILPPPRPPRLSNKHTEAPPRSETPVPSPPSSEETKGSEQPLNTSERGKPNIQIEEAEIFQRLKFPIFLQLSLIHLKLLILKEELQLAIEDKAFQKAKEITTENKLWSQWQEELHLANQDLPSISQDLSVLKLNVLQFLETHFNHCLERDEKEELLAGIDSFRRELISFLEESSVTTHRQILMKSERLTAFITPKDPDVYTYPLPPNKLTHVFLTHTWRKDEEGRDNHMRVGRINEALKKRGIITWFDSERMSGTIRSTMTKGLYSTCCVLIFITKEYEKKINRDDESDNCCFEFKVASEDRQLVNMRIPVVMEKSMTNPNEWGRGILKAELGGKLFFNMSTNEEEEIELQCDEMAKRIMELLKSTYPTCY